VLSNGKKIVTNSDNRAAYQNVNQRNQQVNKDLMENYNAKLAYFKTEEVVDASLIAKTS